MTRTGEDLNADIKKEKRTIKNKSRLHWPTLRTFPKTNVTLNANRSRVFLHVIMFHFFFKRSLYFLTFQVTKVSFFWCCCSWRSFTDVVLPENNSLNIIVFSSYNINKSIIFNPENHLYNNSLLKGLLKRKKQKIWEHKTINRIQNSVMQLKLDSVMAHLKQVVLSHFQSGHFKLVGMHPSSV